MAHQWLICLSPVHIGGAESDSRGNNNPVFRLPDRTPAIPGSALRGALREEAEQHDRYDQYVKNWFGGKTDDISPGRISLGWGWPVWWPVHVLGYGSWWVSCPSWLNRFRQLTGGSPFNFDREQVYMTHPNLPARSTLYLRWLKLTHVQKWTDPLPAPAEVDSECRIVVPDHAINLIVDMGLVRQPRVSLRDEPDEQGSLVQNLFAVEGYPPGAVFMFSWTVRQKVEDLDEWRAFLRGDHSLGGLWSVGYGSIRICDIPE
ncbi:MAG: RAMP superfamily CRISPR-associated protein, partial [Gloeomargarita sp. SKYB31]|nr:RAMP superfamily CRISPR-associated protein [Gloeomargarita sp. SKYB31]